MLKRTLLGSLLLLILVGEPAAARATGLFTVPGFIVLFGLYVALFLFYEALIEKYTLTNFQVVLINFAVYSVLITGLLHGELADYVLHPQHTLITTLIRIQCSCFVIFAWPLISKLAPKTKPALSLKKALLVALGYILFLTPSRQFGVIKLSETLRIAPIQSITFCILAGLAVLVAFYRQAKPKQQAYAGWKFMLVCIGLTLLAAIPLLGAFLILLLAMPAITLVLLCKPHFRHAAISS